jgi:aminoglycoside phosphotransferase (APT) family kinase protein
MTTELPTGLTPEIVAWFAANIDGATAPFHFEMIAGGHSNLTFGVTDANGKRYVLRRPPLGHMLASAHDMGRE